MNPQSAPVKIGRNPQLLRNQLFISSALLTSALLVVAAWVINHQVVRQARQQVQAEVETLLPLYDAVWNEHARRLATASAAMADSPIVKTVFGDARAARDQQTLREMITDAGANAVAPGNQNGSSTPGDLVLMSDGAGQLFFAEQQGRGASETSGKATDFSVGLFARPLAGMPIDLPAARIVGESQIPARGFTILGGRVFQLALTPVVLHSGSAEFNNTLAIIGMGAELSRAMANDIKQRIHSEVVFLVDGRAYASSFATDAERAAISAISANKVLDAPAGRSSELNLGGDLYLAFARPLEDFDGKLIGQVVVLRSLAGAGQLFRAISNQLLMLWSLAIAAAWFLSYLIAGRITRPLESLAASVRAFGQAGQQGHSSQSDQAGQCNDEVMTPMRVQSEVGQLAQAFDQMRQSIKQSQAALLKNERLATIGQMASSIIHDLRNPLATISTAAEVMSNDGITFDRRRLMIETQLRASHRMNDMLTEILEFSRGSYKLSPAPQPLAPIIQCATQELGAQMAQLGIRLNVVVPPQIRLEADAGKLARVFENLLVNALQALQLEGKHKELGAETAGGLVEIRAIQDGVSVRVDVTDNGPGIPAAIRERLFEPFISHGKQGGTGLGLAIARAIVEAHGGRISLNGTQTRGARFMILLPGGKDGA
ncbi:MAG: HAMP domain-containing sensor histidine kinase [Blastocatellia bacterium]